MVARLRGSEWPTHPGRMHLFPSLIVP